MKKYIVILSVLLIVSCVNIKVTAQEPTPTDLPNYILDGTDSIIPDTIKVLENNKSNITQNGNPAYGIISWEIKKLVYFSNVEQPQQWNIIEYQPESLSISGDFVGGNYNKLYVINYLHNELRGVDIHTGIETIIGVMNLHNPGVGGWTGLAGLENGMLYASSTDGYYSYLYTVNIENGNTTYLGKLCKSCIIIDLAITESGRMYALDIHSDVLLGVTLNPLDTFEIGYVGFNANHSQDMDYDEKARKLYLAGYNDNMRIRGGMYLLNTDTGQSTYFGQFWNGEEISAFSFLAPLPSLDIFLPIIIK